MILRVAGIEVKPGIVPPLDPEFRTIVDRLRAKPGYYVNHWIVLAIWPQNRN